MKIHLTVEGDASADEDSLALGQRWKAIVLVVQFTV